MKVSGLVDWGIQPTLRIDLIDGEVQDGVLTFGQFRGLYLSQTNRHYLAALWVKYAVHWPKEISDLVWAWGERLSAGRDMSFAELVEEMKARQLEEA